MKLFVFLPLLYHLQAQLVKLPKSLLTKVPTIKNTEQVLHLSDAGL